MKTKSRPAGPPPVPECHLQAIASSEFPMNLDDFKGKTPSQILGTLFPKTKPEAMAGLVAGLGFDFGIHIPDWAEKASEQFWKYYFGSEFDPMQSPQDAGVIVGLIEG